MTATLRPTFDDVMSRPGGRVLPVVSYPGAQLTGITVAEMVRDPAAQVEAILALHRHLGTRILLTCMDLSVEAEAFGAAVRFADDEVPQVPGRLVTSEAEAAALAVPAPGTARTGVQLEVVRRLVSAVSDCPVVAGVTGPFSLAARLLGVSEALVLTVDAPAVVLTVVERCARFLALQVEALRQAGAGGVFMAEPTAGLLSPRALATFSSPFVKQVLAANTAPGFRLILHNCAARAPHLPAIFASGATAFHFGAPMDLPVALDLAPVDTLVGGNLDPAGVFVNGTPEGVAAAVRALRLKLEHRPGFVLSSGCDLPAPTPMAHLEAFFAAAAEHLPAG
jgi:uroporphyrinogen decarboxylase